MKLERVRRRHRADSETSNESESSPEAPGVKEVIESVTSNDSTIDSSIALGMIHTTSVKTTEKEIESVTSNASTFDSSIEPGMIPTSSAKTSEKVTKAQDSSEDQDNSEMTLPAKKMKQVFEMEQEEPEDEVECKEKKSNERGKTLKSKMTKKKHLLSKRKKDEKKRRRRVRTKDDDDESASLDSRYDFYASVDKSDVVTHALDQVMDYFSPMEADDDYRTLDGDSLTMDTLESELPPSLFSSLFSPVKPNDSILREMEELFMERLGCAPTGRRAKDLNTSAMEESYYTEANNSKKERNHKKQFSTSASNEGKTTKVVSSDNVSNNDNGHVTRTRVLQVVSTDDDTELDVTASFDTRDDLGCRLFDGLFQNPTSKEDDKESRTRKGKKGGINDMYDRVRQRAASAKKEFKSDFSLPTSMYRETSTVTDMAEQSIEFGSVNEDSISKVVTSKGDNLFGSESSRPGDDESTSTQSVKVDAVHSALTGEASKEERIYSSGEALKESTSWADNDEGSKEDKPAFQNIIHAEFQKLKSVEPSKIVSDFQAVLKDIGGDSLSSLNQKNITERVKTLIFWRPKCEEEKKKETGVDNVHEEPIEQSWEDLTTIIMGNVVQEDEFRRKLESSVLKSETDSASLTPSIYEDCDSVQMDTMKATFGDSTSETLGTLIQEGNAANGTEQSVSEVEKASLATEPESVTTVKSVAAVKAERESIVVTSSKIGTKQKMKGKLRGLAKIVRPFFKKNKSKKMSQSIATCDDPQKGDSPHTPFKKVESDGPMDPSQSTSKREAWREKHSADTIFEHTPSFSKMPEFDNIMTMQACDDDWSNSLETPSKLVPTTAEAAVVKQSEDEKNVTATPSKVSDAREPGDPYNSPPGKEDSPVRSVLSSTDQVSPQTPQRKQEEQVFQTPEKKPESSDLMYSTSFPKFDSPIFSNDDAENEEWFQTANSWEDAPKDAIGWKQGREQSTDSNYSPSHVAYFPGDVSTMSGDDSRASF
jgi:hypothetical protein